MHDDRSDGTPVVIIRMPEDNKLATAAMAVPLGSMQPGAILLTPQHSQEALTRAYIHAIAGRAGLTCSFKEFDYTIDVTLEDITVRTKPTTGRKRYFASGCPLDIQIKSTTNAILCDDEVKYDLDVDAYDDLRDSKVSTPRILVLHVQPKDEEERLRLTPEGLALGGFCYWTCLRGYPEVPNTATIRIFIPRGNLLSEASLGDIMKRARNKELR